MPKLAEKLTNRILDDLRSRAEADPRLTEYRADVSQPGLAAWARRGKVRFVFEYRPPTGGPRRRMQIDQYGAITLKQARGIAQTYRGQVAAGIDPQAEKEKARRASLTVGAAIEGYLADLLGRAESGTARRGKRSGYVSAKQLLERHVEPSPGKKRLGDVTDDDLESLKRRMAATPVECNRTLTAVSAVFGWAVRSKHLPPGTNPTQFVERHQETGRRRALTEDEVRALGEALHEAEATGFVTVTRDGVAHQLRVGRPAVFAIRFLALTGFRRADLLGHAMKKRRGEKEGLRWGDTDLDRGIVWLRDSKTGPQERAIGQAAVELLRAARPEDPSADAPVCPGADPAKPFIGIDKPRKYLWEAAGIQDNPSGRADLHSLRHSFASVAANLQDGRYVGMVSALLGHGYQKRSITERYISGDPQKQRPAADAIAAEIARLLGLGKPATVVAFPARGAAEKA
ncbi:MAG TPA: integrase family protein [Thermoanaerobaculia bacterium]|nr:integrase family protein [Thermoanaerobaculia bacterium]